MGNQCKEAKTRAALSRGSGSWALYSLGSISRFLIQVKKATAVIQAWWDEGMQNGYCIWHVEIDCIKPDTKQQTWYEPKGNKSLQLEMRSGALKHTCNNRPAVQNCFPVKGDTVVSDSHSEKESVLASSRITVTDGHWPCHTWCFQGLKEWACERGSFNSLNYLKNAVHSAPERATHSPTAPVDELSGWHMTDIVLCRCL